MSRVLDHGAVLALLPQGHPMVLVDRILHLEPSVSIVGVKAISGCELCYRTLPAGLPPERYAFPASLLLESFGQTAAILWLSGIGGVGRDQVLMLGATRGCRIVGRAYPGDVLQHSARVSHVIGDNVFVEGESRVGDRTVAVVESMVAVKRPRAV
jgi:3-hydroxyacyl-[acyl-carrier-protein] dehydratase